MRLYSRPITVLRIVIKFVLIRLHPLLGLSKLISSPPNIIISLTSRCNKACDFCHYIPELNLPTSKGDELDFESFKKILDSDACPSVGRLCLYGGEPLLNKDFFKMLDEAAARSFLTSTVTNGLLIRKYMDELKKAPLDLMTVSYYPEDSEKTKDSLKEIAPYIPINLSYVISEKRLDQLEEALQFAVDIGAAMVTIENLRENGITEEKSLFEQEEVNLKIKAIHKRFKDSYILRWSSLNPLETKGKKPTCIDFWDTLFVNAKGEISPCCQYPLESYAGSIADKKHSVNSGRMIELRKELLKGDTPKGCEGCHYLYSKDSLYKS